MDTDKILEEVYRFFPRNVNPFDSAFDITPESQNKLIAIKERKKLVHAQWKEMLSKLKSAYPTSIISDDSPLFDRDFCNYCHFSSSGFRFHVLLSVLIPVHTILVTYFTKSAQQRLFTCDYDDADALLQEQGIENVSMDGEPHDVNSRMDRFFQSEAMTKKELDAIIIPDIGTQKLPKGNVPLFQLVFTDYLVEY